MPSVDFLDRARFYDGFPTSALGKGLSDSRRAGFEGIFDVWDSDEKFDVLEWLAYALATAWHETGGVMQPVREGFAKSDAEAYDKVSAYCAKKGISNYAKRHSNGHSYYGRGYVQLTHGTNYQKMGEHLGVGSKFYDDPDSVLDPAVGGMILLVGLIEGLFRPAAGKISDYFSGATQKWYDARGLINGDKATKPGWANGKSIGQLCANYGQSFREALAEVPA